jgi:hypothetical protein
MDEIQIADLTVEQLQTLIRRTVQEAVAEVLVEFSLAAEIDADIAYQAEMTDYLRAALQDRPLALPQLEQAAELDD